jgi:hypothetical protein
MVVGVSLNCRCVRVSVVSRLRALYVKPETSETACSELLFLLLYSSTPSYYLLF